MSRAHTEAQQTTANLIRAAEVEQAAAVLKATEERFEERLREAQREREQADLALDELAGLSRGAALRLHRERLAAVTSERVALAAQADPAPVELRDEASVEEQIRLAMANRDAQVREFTKRLLEQREARLAHLCLLLEQPPRE